MSLSFASLPQKLLRLAVPALLALSLGACSCGGPTENERMCQSLEDGDCPEGVDMFLRKDRRLYISADPLVDSRTQLKLDLQYLPEPEKPQSLMQFYYVIPEGEGGVTIPIDAPPMRAGSYRILIAEEGEEPGRTLEFSVWNTQAEIDARRALGDRRGVNLTRLWICKQPVDNICQENFATMGRGQQRIHLSMRYDDSLPGTKLTATWRRNGAVATSSSLDLGAESGVAVAMFGYKDRPLPPGKYEVEVVASLSKQGVLRRELTIR